MASDEKWIAARLRGNGLLPGSFLPAARTVVAEDLRQLVLGVEQRALRVQHFKVGEASQAIPLTRQPEGFIGRGQDFSFQGLRLHIRIFHALMRLSQFRAGIECHLAIIHLGAADLVTCLFDITTIGVEYGDRQ